MSTLRPMTNDDLLAYKRLCTVCYNYTDTGVPEPLDEEKLRIRMGVFSDDGRLLSAMMQLPYDVRFNGRTVRLVGIGGVVTDPVARKNGAIRQLFEEGLPRLYAEGHVFSALYPFSFQFYGKFGYTWAEFGRNRSICPRDLRDDLMAAEEIIRVLPDDDDRGMREIYNIYIADKDFALHRDGQMWNDLRRGTPWADMKHAYVLKIGAKAVSYWIGTVHKGEEATLRIADMAWTCRAGRDAIFAMLRGMNELGRIEVAERGTFDLRALAAEAYDVDERGSCKAMVRVVNAAKALSLLTAPPVAGRVAIRVTDGQIPDNNGVFVVTGDGNSLSVVKDLHAQADVSCTIGGLSALICGRETLAEAIENGTADRLTLGENRFAGMLFERRRLHMNHNF